MNKYDKESNLTENQQGAIDYLKNNKIEYLYTEMLNNLVNSQSKEPVIHMIRYLASLVEESELENEGIKVEKLEKIEPSPLIKDFHFPSTATVFLKNYIKPEVYEKLKEVRTALGGHISHIIHAGLKVDNKETVGIYATDGEAYTKFAPIFQPAQKTFQDYDKNFALYDIPDHRGVFSLGKDLSIKERLMSIRMKYARNLKGYPYNPYAKPHTLREVKEKLLTIIRSYQENEKGNFYEMNDDKIQELESQFFDREENLFNSFGTTKEHSGIFLSEDQKVAYLINFNDHLQMVLYDSACNYADSYQRLKKIHSHFESHIEFDYHSNYGYLTTCPSNVGMGLKISSWLNIPNVVNQGNFLVCCKRWSLRFKKNLNALGHKGDNEIISKHKHGVSEVSFINSYISKICSLINFENNLQFNPDYVEKPLDVSRMKENIKALYQTFFDKYKFVTTPNLKSFNSLFKLDSTKGPAGQYFILIPDKESYILYNHFIFDYITAFTNINMLEITQNAESLAKLKELYASDTGLTSHHNLTSEVIQNFDSQNFKNLKRITMVLRRNIKKHNFTESLNEAQLKKMYTRFLALCNDIKEAFGGSVIEETEIKNLYSTEFKFIFEEFMQMFKDKCKQFYLTLI